jgi:hypothetical protein
MKEEDNDSFSPKSFNNSPNPNITPEILNSPDFNTNFEIKAESKKNPYVFPAP